MRVAVLADIHANLPALTAVLRSIEKRGADRVVCLGDLVGYNAQPRECLDMLGGSTDWIVAGNHDREALEVSSSPSERPSNTSDARRALAWTQTQLQEGDRRFLDLLPARVLDPMGLVGVHGCYLNETHVNGYVTSTMLEDNLRAVLLRTGWPRIALCGHTHQPMCGFLRGRDCHETPPGPLASWPRDAEAVLINPGSVGQPRDGDPRAAFALVDLERRSVSFERVPYDIESAVLAIVNAGLPDSLGQRLREGR